MACLEIDVWEKAEGWEFGSFAVISLHSCMSWRIDDQLPMKKPDALFQLISSLSRGEKRNFRMLAQLTSGDKKYLQIFDIVDLMEEYDEAKVIRKFRNDPGFERQFAYIKNYLYNSILSSLVYFRRVPDAERSSLLLQVRILLEKNLHMHAKKLLKKAKEKVNEQEKYEDLISLLQMEIEIVKRTEPVEMLASSYHVVDFEEREAFDKLLNLREYRKLEQQTHLLLSTHFIARQPTDIAEVDKILGHPCMAAETAALSNRGKILYNEINRRIARFKSQLPEAMVFAARVVELYEAFPAIRDSERYLYMSQVSLLAHLQTLVSGISISLPTILKIRDTEATTAQERMFKFEKYYLYALGFSMDSGQLVSEDFIKEFDVEYSFLDNEIGVATTILVSYMRSQYHFVHGQYSEALKWINKVINHPRTNTQTDIQTCARLLDMMIHYELGNLDLIDYSLKSAHRFIYKKERMKRFEQRVLSLFRKLVSEGEEGRINEFEAFRADLAEIIKDPLEKHACAVIKVPEWVECKCTGANMAELLAMNNAHLVNGEVVSLA